jgi:hypothetical protein
MIISLEPDRDELHRLRNLLCRFIYGGVLRSKIQGLGHWSRPYIEKSF